MGASTRKPAGNHQAGHSTSSIGSCASPPRPKMRASPLNERTTLRQSNRNDASPEATNIDAPGHTVHSTIFLYETVVMTPSATSEGASIPYVSTLPRSSDHAVRKLISAPAPSSTTSLLSSSVHSAALRPAIEKPSGIFAGTLNGIHASLASRNHVSSAAPAAAIASARAFSAPSPALPPCSVSSVSAVAVPVGNASCSLLISWRLIGIAANTPSAAISANQPIIGSVSGRCSPWCVTTIISSAP